MTTGRPVDYLVSWDSSRNRWRVERNCIPVISIVPMARKEDAIAAAIAAGKKDAPHANKVWVQSRQGGKFKMEWQSPG